MCGSLTHGGHRLFGRRSFAFFPLRPHCLGWPFRDFPAASDLCDSSNARPSGQSWVFVPAMMSLSLLIGLLQSRHHPTPGSSEVSHASIISIRFGGNSIGTQSSSISLTPSSAGSWLAALCIPSLPSVLRQPSSRSGKRCPARLHRALEKDDLCCGSATSAFRQIY